MSRRVRGRTGRTVHARYPGREAIPVPDYAWDLSRRRTEYLHAMAATHSVAYLVACAWMQGVADADQALGRPHIAEGA